MAFWASGSEPTKPGWTIVWVYEQTKNQQGIVTVCWNTMAKLLTKLVLLFRKQKVASLRC